MNNGFILTIATPVDILLDTLRILGRDTDIEYILNEEHNWEDVSYHGSPTYRCSFCNCYQIDVQSSHCAKAKEQKARKLIEKESKEYYEYLRLKKEKEHYQYLQEKFGHLD